MELIKIILLIVLIVIIIVSVYLFMFKKYLKGGVNLNILTIKLAMLTVIRNLI